MSLYPPFQQLKAPNDAYHKVALQGDQVIYSLRTILVRFQFGIFHNTEPNYLNKPSGEELFFA